MGIGWLWIYTNSETLAKENESRAFAFYSRWRAVIRWVADRYTHIRKSRRERLLRKPLLELSDHLLKDIGMFHTGADVQKEEPDRLTLLKRTNAKECNTESKPNAIEQGKCAEIMDIDQFRVKPFTTPYDPIRKSQCR